MAISNSWRSLFAVTALVLASGAPDIALAGARQNAILQSYVGEWSGIGELTGGDEPERFSCRNNIVGSNDGKIYYQGRCAVAGMNLGISGTVRYNDDTNRYEGNMNSTTKFEGVAIGRPRGSSIVFDFKQQNQHEGHELTIDAKLTLNNNDTYTVDFDVWVADSDIKMTTSVPFERN